MKKILLLLMTLMCSGVLQAQRVIVHQGVAGQLGVYATPYSIIPGQVADATATVRGVVNTGTQTFGGNKTFNGSVSSGVGLSSTAATESYIYSNINATLCTLSTAAQLRICGYQSRVTMSADTRPAQNVIERLPERRTASIAPAGAGASTTAVGEGAVAVDNGNNTTLPTDTAPFFWNQLTTAGSGNVVSLSGNGLTWRTGKNFYWTETDIFSRTTSMRFWAGLTSATGTGPVAAVAGDDSLITAGSFRGAAFRYSTNASDTTYRCITSNGTTQTSTSSGVAVSTGVHIFEIREDNTANNILFFIDRALVCTMTATLPSAGGNVNLGYIRSATTLTTSIFTLGFGGLYISEDMP